MADFDLCIIGSGSGNTIVDERFDSYRIALVDAGRFGGTCLNAGCIPTKMFCYPADLSVMAAHAELINVDLKFEGIDFDGLSARVFGRTDQVSASGLEWRKSSPNVTVFEDLAHFVDPHTLQVGSSRITANRFVLAAGSRPTVPDIPGVDDPDLQPYIHTSETIMRISRPPRRLVIVGGGFVAAEFSHIFTALGTEVTQVARANKLLRYEDLQVAAQYTRSVEKLHRLRLNQRPVCVEAGRRGGIQLRTADGFAWEYSYDTDMVLFATGRQPNSDTLGLSKAGVDFDPVSGLVVVDSQQRTSADHIWALGDICNPEMLKHVANAEARTVQQNLLVELTGSGAPIETDHRFIPHAIFANPQIASVGQTEQQLVDSKTPYRGFVQNYSDVAYGWAMADTDHFVKVLANPESGQLLGAHILGPQASVLIQPLVQAMSFGIDVHRMARGQYWIHPALAEVVENALLGVAALMPSNGRP